MEYEKIANKFKYLSIEEKKQIFYIIKFSKIPWTTTTDGENCIVNLEELSKEQIDQIKILIDGKFKKYD